MCTLHSVSKKSCLRCKREYGLEDTHCYRCYICPECECDLESHPLLYKAKYESDKNELEIIKSKNDRSKIVGKSVQFKCVNMKCRFKFTTKIETNPQTLQHIVQSNIKDEDELRYDTLLDYYDWCMNYHRILDKRQRTKWKTEILNRFKAFEISKILQENCNIKDLNDKEKDIINTMDTNEKNNVLYPQPKLLHAEMKSICPTCLGDLSHEKMASSIPLVYAVPLIGFPSSKLKKLELEVSIDIPILVSFINNTTSTVNFSIINEDEDEKVIQTPSSEIKVECTDGGFNEKHLKTVPTCLLSHVSKNETTWKKELHHRSFENLAKLKYSDTKTLTDFGDILDSGINWVTTHVVIHHTVKNESCKNKIEFGLNISGDFNVHYNCTALI